jgi:hypothetical protein
MATNRADRILGEWSAVARTATAPAPPAPSAATGQGGLGVSLLGAVVLAMVLVVALAWLSGRDEGSNVGGPDGSSPTPGLPSTAPGPTDSPAPAVPAPPTPEPTLEPTPAPTPSASLLATCDPSALAPRVTQWEGAAGSRIAHVQMTNTAGRACQTPDVWQPLLVDGNGEALIEGSAPTVESFVIIPADGTVTTLVLTNNYCKPAPIEPVSIAFVVNGEQVTATTDPETETLLPPCNGPGEPGTIEMTSWGF